jgi:hypothetical protein
VRNSSGEIGGKGRKKEIEKEWKRKRMAIPIANPSSVNTKGSLPKFFVFLWSLSFIVRIFS